MKPCGFKTQTLANVPRLSRFTKNTIAAPRSNIALPCEASSSFHSSKNKNKSNRSRRGGSHPTSAPSPSKVSLDNEAFQFDWEVCTVRGYPDGDLVYKFGSIDPPNNHDSPAIVQPIQWSNGIRLGIKYSTQIHKSLAKLDTYVKQYKFGRKLHPRQELKHAIHKSYTKAVRKIERLRAGDVGDGEDSSSGSSGSDDEENTVHEEENAGDEMPTLVRPAPPRSKAPVIAAEAKAAAAAPTAAPTKTASPGNEGMHEEGEPPEKDEQQKPKKPKNSFNLDSFFSWVVTFFIPYGIRKLFHGEWPPQVSGPHVSPTLAGLLKDASSMTRESLADVGFDPQGRSRAPLDDITAWQMERLVGCRVRNISLYRSALTHPTALPSELRHLSYQRLEYLGDSVLELCVREILLQRSPEADEGEMTMQAQNLVNGTQLSIYSTWLGLDHWIASNAYSMRDGLMGSPYVLGDAFEALVGAVYLDNGLEAARAFLVRVLRGCPAVTFDDLPTAIDYKGELNRVAGRMRQAIPTYHVKDSNSRVFNDETGVKRKFWIIQVYMDGRMIGTGSSFTKREAEQLCARDALVNLGELEKIGEEENKQ